LNSRYSIIATRRGWTHPTAADGGISLNGARAVWISDNRACNVVRDLQLSPELITPQQTKSPDVLWAPTINDPTDSAAPGIHPASTTAARPRRTDFSHDLQRLPG
jgi:hypothetical protein